MSKPVYRCHYRGRLETDDRSVIDPLMAECKNAARAMIDEGKLMTAGLFYHGNMVFLYYEAIGEECAPESFMSALHPILAQWPEKEETRDWARMHMIFWHNEPIDDEDWKRTVKPDRRRGRIALLKPDKIWGYVYHHYAIVQEGLLTGDRYQAIALHEDILFSYFEEPKGTTFNIRRVENLKSEAIKGWAAVNPSAHFTPLPGSGGENFLILPDYFTVGDND